MSRSLHASPGQRFVNGAAGAFHGWQVWLLALLLAAAGSAVAAEQPLGVVVMMGLKPGSAPEASWLITTFEPQTSTSGDFGDTTFESGAALSAVVTSLKKLSLPSACPLNALMPALRAHDGAREWLGWVPFTPRVGFQRVCLLYRYRPQPFLIELHVHGEQLDAPPVTRPLPDSPGVFFSYRGTPASPPALLAPGMMTAAERGWQIARANGYGPNAPPGDKVGVKAQLEQTFRLGVPNTGEESYSAKDESGRALGLQVQPVFVPREIRVELTNWRALETDEPPAIASALARKRYAREAAIRAKLAPHLPGAYALVTPAMVETWRATPAGREFEVSAVRYEDETLVLGAVDAYSTQHYVAEIGATYGATEGLQGAGKLSVLHEHRTHLEAGVEASYGDKADSQGAHFEWKPRRRVGGWDLSATGSASARRERQALFGATTATQPLEWRRWQADVGLTARQPQPEPRPGRWTPALTAGLHLLHSDDAFAGAPAVPADAARPDSRVEIRTEWRAATLLGEDGPEVEVSTQVRLAQAIQGVEGNYSYRLGDVAVNASLVTARASAPRWKLMSTTRAGRLSGDAPLGRLFRAGGDEGWIRGLQEGELVGRGFWAQSFAAGPDISSLLGGSGDAEGARRSIFLLAFYDFGGVEEATGGWRSAQGMGVAVHLADLPLGAQKGALTLGYAYSPDSAREPHGAVFMRFELPFVQ